jgi:hypothetical protein
LAVTKQSEAIDIDEIAGGLLRRIHQVVERYVDVSPIVSHSSRMVPPAPIAIWIGWSWRSPPVLGQSALGQAIA